MLVGWTKTKWGKYHNQWALSLMLCWLLLKEWHYCFLCKVKWVIFFWWYPTRGQLCDHATSAYYSRTTFPPSPHDPPQLQTLMKTYFKSWSGIASIWSFSNTLNLHMKVAGNTQISLLADMLLLSNAVLIAVKAKGNWRLPKHISHFKQQYNWKFNCIKIASFCRQRFQPSQYMVCLILSFPLDIYSLLRPTAVSTNFSNSS